MMLTILEFIQQPEFQFYALTFISVGIFTYVIGKVVQNSVDINRRASVKESNPAPFMRADISGREPDGWSESLNTILSGNQEERTGMRKFLSLAGFEQRYALLVFQIIRLLTAMAFGVIVAVYGIQVAEWTSYPKIVGASVVGVLLGFYLPKILVSFRRDKVCQEHREGFPDFLDLMVISADAGISIESGIDRVSSELTYSFPSLAKNLHVMSLELRAGRSKSDALDNLVDRLGIDEARSFATLVQQSDELGSSLVQALRVYSDEMRDKRYARAEEKAMGLPAKLVIPLGFFVFPIILTIVLLPVVLKLYKALGI